MYVGLITTVLLTKVHCLSKSHQEYSSDKRNTCRSCRLTECMRRGMRREAVQNERDRIRPASSPIPDDPLLDSLLSAEATVRQLRSSVITRTTDARRAATTGDVTDSMNQQLILMVEWAKALPQFQKLPMQPQISLLRFVLYISGLNQIEVSPFEILYLLQHTFFSFTNCKKNYRNFSAQHLVMCAAFRSIQLKDAVWLTNETCLHKDSPKIPDIK